MTIEELTAMPLSDVAEHFLKETFHPFFIDSPSDGTCGVIPEQRRLSPDGELFRDYIKSLTIDTLVPFCKALVDAAQRVEHGRRSLSCLNVVMCTAPDAGFREKADAYRERQKARLREAP